MSELPSGWAEATVQQLVGAHGVATDGDWIETKDQDPRGEVRLIQLADIGDGAFRDRSKRFVTLETARRLNCTFLERGDLRIARMPDPLGRACIFPGVDRKAITAVDVFVWRRSDDRVDSRWLMHFINSPDCRVAIAEEAGGTTRQRSAGGRLKALEIPVPPSAEQRRIVAKIDSLSEKSKRARDRLGHVPRLVERYKGAVLRAAFRGSLTRRWRDQCGFSEIPDVTARIDEPIRRTFAGPGSWGKVTFDDICEIIGGSQPPKATFQYTPCPDLIRLIQIRDYKSDAKATYIPKELARRFCSKSDIMIGRYGPPIFQILRGLEGAYNVALMKAVPKKKMVGPDFLFWYLHHPDLFDYVNVEAQRTAGQDGVNKAHLTKWPVLLPSLPEQNEIVRRIETAFAWIDRLAREAQSARKLIDRLDQAILSKAFRGELVPQDPSDEPASVLLERIRAERKGPVSRKRRTA
jgi:type I restriction enzyme S subunit